MTMTNEALVAEAWRAREFAQATYSKFPVGAALLTKNGNIFWGANVESSSYGLSICAERVALFTALTAGHTTFERLAVAAQTPLQIFPCGACLQLLNDYAGDITVLLSKSPSEIIIKSLRELLPYPFGNRHFDSKS